jgi:hypothetical protein
VAAALLLVLRLEETDLLQYFQAYLLLAEEAAVAVPLILEETEALEEELDIRRELE